MSVETTHNDDHRAIIKRVAWVLVGVGLLDGVGLVVAAESEVTHLAALHLFAVFGGALLLAGGVAMARRVAWVVALWLTAAVGMTLVLPLLDPWALKVALFREAPALTAAQYLYQVVVLAVLVWAYRALRDGRVQAARERQGLRSPRPIVALVLGVLLVGALGIADYGLNHGRDAEHARALARAEFGDRYDYHVVRMAFGADQAEARLRAYNAGGVRTVEVTWPLAGDAADTTTPDG